VVSHLEGLLNCCPRPEAKLFITPVRPTTLLLRSGDVQGLTILSYAYQFPMLLLSPVAAHPPEKNTEISWGFQLNGWLLDAAASIIENQPLPTPTLDAVPWFQPATTKHHSILCCLNL
jgi:hypothetical protein